MAAGETNTTQGAIELDTPVDAHLHLRDGPLLAAVLPATARQFARAVVMPNLRPPVHSCDDAAAYRERILAALPVGADFAPMMSLYLTEQTTPAEVERAAALDWVCGIKLYPAGATTHSDAGVSSLEGLGSVLEAMARCELPLQVHAETTDPGCDIFDREAVFVEETLVPLVARHPGLRLVVEHVSTREAVDFVRAQGPGVAATITPQHLLLNRNDLFAGGLQPHHYCLPVLKHEHHRRAVLEAAVSGSPKFFLGTDSAPHLRATKECTSGCAGIYSAPLALELYTLAFESAGALDRLEGFASHAAADFYGWPRSRRRTRLMRRAWKVPESLQAAGDTLVPLFAGRELAWQLAE